MAEQNPSASGILRRRYVGDDPARAAAVERERVNADVAQMIHERRTAAGLTQRQLAELVGTRQSVISRLEDADYEGHSIAMLHRIADALDQRLRVQMLPADPDGGVIRFAFREVMRALRRRKRLTLDALAQAIDADRAELAAVEQREGYRPSALLLLKLSRFHGVPQEKLAALAGVSPRVEPALRQHASRFVAHAESAAKLTSDERRTVDEFVRFLQAGG